MNFKQAQEILLRNDKYAKAYDDATMSFEIARTVIQARNQRGITQKELAQLVGTGQSSIARLESGDSLPSLSFLQKVATALDMLLLPPLFVSPDEVSYLMKSESDTRQLKVKLIDTRKNLFSGSKPSIKVTSGNSYIEVTGGIL